MKLQTKLLFLCLVVALVFAEDEEEDRDKRQTQPYFTGGLSSHRPTPKPQPFTGALQTVVSRFPGLGGPPPQGFRTATPIEEDEDEVNRNAVSPTPTPQFRPQPTPQALAYRSPSPPPQQQVLRSRPGQQEFHSQSARRPQVQRPQYAPQQQQQQLTEEELEELEEEKEEPDRLTLLLPQSKFSCQSKNTGYYADEGLNCEVFHYCQDSARHSWICPEGFLFHQVHLICMPPNSDNICKQSTQYHFVNDYLYRPINTEEHQNKPNVSLRYADRYYPENYYEEAEESQPSPSAAPAPASRPRPQQQQYQQQQQLRSSPLPQQYRQTQSNQVFHSPEEVNIPLQQRRPVPTNQPHRNYPQSSSQYDFQ